jgi:hypothetical protein
MQNTRSICRNKGYTKAYDFIATNIKFMFLSDPCDRIKFARSFWCRAFYFKVFHFIVSFHMILIKAECFIFIDFSKIPLFALVRQAMFHLHIKFQQCDWDNNSMTNKIRNHLSDWSTYDMIMKESRVENNETNWNTRALNLNFVMHMENNSNNSNDIKM